MKVNFALLGIFLVCLGYPPISLANKQVFKTIEIELGSHKEKFYNRTPRVDVRYNRYLTPSKYIFALYSEYSKAQDVAVFGIGMGAQINLTGSSTGFGSLTAIKKERESEYDNSVNGAAITLGVSTVITEKVDFRTSYEMTKYGKTYQYDNSTFRGIIKAGINYQYSRALTLSFGAAAGNQLASNYWLGTYWRL